MRSQQVSSSSVIYMSHEVGVLTVEKWKMKVAVKNELFGTLKNLKLSTNEVKK